jgi:hypothetical protein
MPWHLLESECGQVVATQPGKRRSTEMPHMTDVEPTVVERQVRWTGPERDEFVAAFTGTDAAWDAYWGSYASTVELLVADTCTACHGHGLVPGAGDDCPDEYCACAIGQEQAELDRDELEAMGKAEGWC